MTTTLSATDLRRAVKSGPTTTDILRGCDLELHGGGLTAVVGHSGSGKSSLLMCLSGLDEPTSGTVTINEQDIYRQSASRRASMLRTEIGFVFQQYNLVPFLTVEENITLPFQLDRAKVPRDTITRLIESFGLGRRRRAPARTLSGGEQQRTALCRALARRPGIVFADEPTGALDSQSTGIVLHTLRQMADEGQMIVMVTHDLEAAAFADTVIVMHDGRTVDTIGRTTSQELLGIMSSLGA
ncbi:ABC transporter ATP-binding protein [Brevibacterium luteolum]|uniref:ABC transporter ATP-binding protein n=1 Tax=Brevibacterium luteolum TaxID=199591 RepID=UPI001C248A5D|nr:ABC transporter ATP-binding protein [Brevibacterium luteolum]MBU8579775.1 ABC transporter ATP-binding protein [Brevibacterium luteolum]